MRVNFGENCSSFCILCVRVGVLFDEEWGGNRGRKEEKNLCINCARSSTLATLKFVNLTAATSVQLFNCSLFRNLSHLATTSLANLKDIVIII